MMSEDKTEELKYVQGILEKEKAELESILKATSDIQQKGDLIGKINLIKFSQELLRRCYEYNVMPRDIWRKVPSPRNEYAEYRLMEDNKTKDRKSWREEPDFRLNGGEITIG